MSVTGDRVASPEGHGLGWAVVPESRRSALARFFSPENRYLPPLFITTILVTAHLSFGILESVGRTALAIGTAIVAELVFGRIALGKWPHLASAYVSGISVGILVRSPFYWPFALCSAISIVSKFALRMENRHLWNPSNFGVSAMLVLAPDAISGLSIQWGNRLWASLVIWVLGSIIVARVGRFHISATYALSFLFFSAVRSALTGHSFLASVAPITGPMYQLFTFFMVTDPKTTVSGKKQQCAVAFLVALVEAVLRLQEVVYAPFYALFLVGPATNVLEILVQRRARRRAAALAASPS